MQLSGFCNLGELEEWAGLWKQSCQTSWYHQRRVSATDLTFRLDWQRLKWSTTQGRRDDGTQGRSNIEPLFRSNLGLKSGTSELHENWSGRMEYFRLKWCLFDQTVRVTRFEITDIQKTNHISYICIIQKWQKLKVCFKQGRFLRTIKRFFYFLGFSKVLFIFFSIQNIYILFW